MGDRSELTELLRPCSHVISSCGHRLTFKGMCCAPRSLCTDTVKLICELAQELRPASPLRLIVINTEGCDRLEVQTQTWVWGAPALVVSVVLSAAAPRQCWRDELPQPHGALQPGSR